MNTVAGNPLPGKNFSVQVTRFPDAAARTKTEVLATLPQLAGMIESATASMKAGLPWLKLALFGSLVSPAGSLRWSRNLTHVSGVEGDYDDGVLEFDVAASRLRAAGLAHLIYTSPSYTGQAGGHRWRVLVPFSAEVPAGPDAEALRSLALDRVEGVLGVKFASESRVAAQAYYYGRAGLAPFKIEYFEPGEFVDVGLVTKPNFQPQQQLSAAGRELDEFEVRALLDRMPNEKSSPLTLPWEDRQGWVEVGAALFGVSGGAAWCREMWAEWSALWDGDRTEAERVWDTFGEVRSGVPRLLELYDGVHGAGAGVRLLAGLKRPGAASAFDELCLDAPPDPTKTAAVAARAARKFTLVAETFVGRALDQFEPREFIDSRGLLLRGAVTLLAGPPGVAKSTFIVNYLATIASGQTVFCNQILGPQPVKVLYVSGDDDRDEIWKRLAACEVHHALPAGKFQFDVLASPMPGFEKFVLVESDGRGGSRLNDESFEALEELVSSGRYDVVVVDPLANFAAAAEQSSRDFLPAMNRLVAMARAHEKCALVLVHHERKSASGAHAEASLDNARGTGALGGAVRVARSMRRIRVDDLEELGLAGVLTDDEVRRLYVLEDTKNSYQGFGSKWFLKIETLRFGNARRGYAEDKVGVLVPWVPPQPQTVTLPVGDLQVVADAVDAGFYNESVQSLSELAEASGMPVKRVRVLLDALKREGYIVADRVIEEGEDGRKRSRTRLVLQRRPTESDAGCNAE